MRGKVARGNVAARYCRRGSVAEPFIDAFMNKDYFIVIIIISFYSPIYKRSEEQFQAYNDTLF
jgi:hypothetical protein